MTIEIWWAYLATVLVFMSTPGPSHLLMLSNSLGNGFSKASATAAGDLSANFLQMLAASLGLASVLLGSQHAFIVIKWLGVLYLVFLGAKLIFSNKSSVHASAQRSRSALYWQGFITSAANPKAVIFFGALFPQFISSEHALWPQFLVLSITYLIVDGLFLCAYGKFADRLVVKFRANTSNTLSIISGSLLIGAAMLLGIKDMEAK